MTNCQAKFKPTMLLLELHKRQLGIDGTGEFFKLMQDLNYKVESYIPRDLDTPLIGTMNDITQSSINHPLDMIENNQAGSFLTLSLVNSSKESIE